ncbi:MAG: hypothetical protein MUE88_00505 [Flavobacteriales bacterium]|jgi:hypothetical protein|nr:hypothetical protein [Flavobacteriales bacterium]
MRALLLLLFLPHMATVCAQREAHRWYFGPEGVGLDFSTCPPTVVEDGLGAATFEGACTISDPVTGELLFYTTGLAIMNADHTVMVNGEPSGLMNSMAQNVIVPKPGSSTLYYVFTPDVQGGLVLNTDYPDANGLNMAIVDMSLDFGRGAVVDKFIPVRPPPNCELLTAVRHSNGIDFWLIGHVFGTDEFFVYAITADGVSDTPLLQAIGPIIDTPQPGTPDGSNFDAIGHLKASPKGDRLALTTFYNGRTAVFDFDAATGIISNAIPLFLGKGGYGVCFSPGGSKLYVSARDTSQYGIFFDADLFQFDLNAGDAAAIQASRTAIFSPTVGGFASMRLGPDGRIYVARASENLTPEGDDHLGVIVRPELPGTACTYIHDGIFLNGQRGSWSLNNLYEVDGPCGEDLPTEVAEADGPLALTVSVGAAGLELQWPTAVEASRASVHNADGRLLREFSLSGARGRAYLPLSGIASGSYFVVLSTPTERATARWMIAP